MSTAWSYAYSSDIPQQSGLPPDSTLVMLHEEQGQRTAVVAGACAVCRESCAPLPAIAPLATCLQQIALDAQKLTNSWLNPRATASTLAGCQWPRRLSASPSVDPWEKWTGHACVLFCAPWESQLPRTGHSMRGLGWTFVLCLTGDINCCYLVLESKAPMY